MRAPRLLTAAGLFSILLTAVVVAQVKPKQPADASRATKRVKEPVVTAQVKPKQPADAPRAAKRADDSVVLAQARPRRPGFQPRPPVPGTTTPGTTTPGTTPGTTAPGAGTRGFLPEGIDLVAGVLLDRTAELTSDLADITGAAVDPSTGRFILVGRQGAAEAVFHPADLIVVLRSILLGRAPGVSIEDPIVDGMMTVRYLGNTEGTHVGQVMFEADRLLKSLAMGRDTITRMPMRPRVPGYRSELELLAAFGGTRLPGAWHRYWFRPAQVIASLSPDGRSIQFQKATMAVLTEYVPPQAGGASEPAAEAFARHVTEHYDDYAEAYPALAELRTLAKLTALASWIVEQKIPINTRKVWEAQLPRVDTPSTTPMGFSEMVERVPEGLMKHQVRGGVDLGLRRSSPAPDRPRNWFTGVSQDTAQLQRLLISAKAGTPKWNISFAGGDYTAVVLAQTQPRPVAQTAKKQTMAKKPRTGRR